MNDTHAETPTAPPGTVRRFPPSYVARQLKVTYNDVRWMMDHGKVVSGTDEYGRWYVEADLALLKAQVERDKLAMTPIRHVPCDRAPDIVRTGTYSAAPRDLHLLALHYGWLGDPPVGVRVLAKRFGLSTSRVQQLHQRAIVRILATATVPDLTPEGL